MNSDRGSQEHYTWDNKQGFMIIGRVIREYVFYSSFSFSMEEVALNVTQNRYLILVLRLKMLLPLSQLATKAVDNSSSICQLLAGLLHTNTDTFHRTKA